MYKSLQQSRNVVLDALRGLLILLMVMGHTTNPFGLFIYHFHVASFFILSGYLLKFEVDPFSFIKARFIRLMIPFFVVNLTIEILSRLLLKFGAEGYFVKTSIQGIFLNWTTNPLGGASWFLPVLFVSSVFSFCAFRCLYSLRVKGELLKYCVPILAIVFFLFAYEMFSNKIILPNMIDLSLLATGYLLMGWSLKNIKGFEVGCLLFVLLLCYLLFRVFFLPTHTNWPTRSFNTIIGDVTAAVSGFVCFMYVINLVSNYKITKVFLGALGYLGRVTLPILFLHFIGFKLVYFLFYKLGLVSKGQIYELVPTEAFQLWYWVVIGGILFSIVVFEVTKRSRVIKKYFWGQAV